MKTRNLFFALVVGIALATVPLAGCGDSTDDPSANNSNNVNNVNNANNDKQDVGGGDEDTNNGGEDTNNGGEDTNNGGEDTNNGNNGGGDDCELNTTFQGQIGGSRTHEGGTFSTTPYTNDAGIKAVVDAVASTGKTTHEPPLKITGARVVATTFSPHSNKTFWLQDANGGIQTYLASDAGNVKVGQKVSFDVVTTGVNRGHAQITEIANFVIEEDTGPVYVQDKTGVTLTDDDYLTMVRIGGTLSDKTYCDRLVDGAPDPSVNNPAYCYSLNHGGSEVLFRSKSAFLDNGKCVTYVGPLSADLGPKADGVTSLTLQADSINHDWHYAVRDDL